MRQITRDHSLVQELVESGAIRPEEAEHHPRANVITRAVGAELDEFALDKVSGRILVPGDRFLLCSDGLCKTVPDDELATLLGAINGAPPQAPGRCRLGGECHRQRDRGRGRVHRLSTGYPASWPALTKRARKPTSLALLDTRLCSWFRPSP